MKACLDNNGKIIPPASVTAARDRHSQLLHEIERIQRQTEDPRRREKYVSDEMYDSWRMAAIRARRYLESEAKQLAEWIAAHPETDLLLAAHRVLCTLREEDALKPSEIAVVARLDAHFKGLGA